MAQVSGSGRRWAAALLVAVLFLPPPAVLAADTAGPPYDPQLVRLSEILGALHYLRPLCGANEDTVWRDEMQAFIDAESPDGPRRQAFIDAFNRGYESYRSVYRVCTAGATETIDRYLKEGAQIAHDVTTRYGK